jgi:type IV secretion system protein VirB6/type IV secretion system protein TrbL
MRMPAALKIAVPLFVWLAFFSIEAHAAIDSTGVFDNVLARYQAAAAGWAGYITGRATWLFWTLVVISMVWTFGMMALRKADIGEFFAEFVRFTIFTGFFWWLLTNGPNFASSIYASLRQVGSSASGLPNTLSPSGIVDIGFDIFYKVLDQSSVWSPVDSFVGILLATTILVVLALVGVNMLLLLASGWILAYAGVFFLGFGGSRWTSDMAINYYKTVLGVAAQLMTMVLLVGIGKTFLDDYYAQMSVGINLKEMGVMMIVVIILLMLVNKVPGLISGVITGASVGHAGIGNFGAGAAVGAAGVAAAAAATGGAMIAAGAANAAGGAQAVMAAFSKANENVQSGSDVLTSMWGGGGGNDGGGGSGGGGSGGGSDSGGSSPFAQAAGFGGAGSSSSSTGTKGEKSEGGDAKGKDGGSADQAKSQGGDNKQAASNNGTSSGAGQGSSSTGGQSAPASSGGLLAAAANAGKIAADAGANLAAGTAAVAKEKAASMMDSAKERIADTTGGKIAAAIKAMGTQDTPIFSEENSLSGSGQADPESEVAAFARRDRDSKSA